MSASHDDSELARPTPDELARRWSQVANDPVLRNLPYRLELNKWGHVEMTAPPSPMRMVIATTLAALLRERLGPKTLTECAITTPGGIKVADVVWCSGEFLDRHRDAFSHWEAALPQAPELCVEVMSPSNIAAELKEKIALYVEAGATEGWIVYPDRRIEVYDASGLRSASSFPVELSELSAALQAL